VRNGLLIQLDLAAVYTAILDKHFAIKPTCHCVAAVKIDVAVDCVAIMQMSGAGFVNTKFKS